MNLAVSLVWLARWARTNTAVVKQTLDLIGHGCDCARADDSVLMALWLVSHMTTLKLQSHCRAHIPLPGPRIVLKFTRPSSILEVRLWGRDYSIFGLSQEHLDKLYNYNSTYRIPTDILYWGEGMSSLLVSFLGSLVNWCLIQYSPILQCFKVCSGTNEQQCNLRLIVLNGICKKGMLFGIFLINLAHPLRWIAANGIIILLLVG